MHKDATTVEMNAQTRINRGKRGAMIILALAAIFIAAVSTPIKDHKKTFTVVIDPGHGGKDPGNIGTGRFKRTEKNISLDVSLQVGKYIQDNYPEVEVIYTRTGDTYPELYQRCEMANKANADLFISIHCNANDNRQAFGTETFVMGLHKSEESLKTAMRENASIYLEDNYEKNYGGFDPKNPDTYIAMSLRENIFLDQSLALAKNVQDEFRVKVGRKDRGVKQAGYYVIAFTNMPSILVELGFLTNETEEDFLHSDDGKTYMASAIYRAFKAYKEKTELKTGKPSSTNTSGSPEEKKPETVPDSVRPEPETTGIAYNEVKTGIKFQVQILTSSKPLNKKSNEFRGLDKVDEYISGNVYKYMAGCTSSFQEAKSIQKKLREKGFTDAFIVAFENGQRIDLNEAIRKTTN